METGAMKEAAQAKLASVTYSRCSGIALTKAHASLLRVLIGELQSKVAALVDPNFDSGDVKSKRGRKKDVDSSVPVKRTKLNILPINELTWPELARRYVLAVLAMDGNLESAEITARESSKVFRCLQGDGGVLCGSLTGVAGMEADALLLAESTKQIFASFNRENDVLTIEEEVSDGGAGANEKNLGNGGNTPVWAQVLEPVRKLPTNVGTRIRKCVYEALDKDPPEWARKILEHSISKEVYKGNASGPTKKAVLSVLADVRVKACYKRLRREESGRLIYLFLMTIDLRLAAGSYGGSHEAFLEDVRELWSNLRIAYGDQPDLVELAETLAQTFETLYEKEVITLVHKLAETAKLECLSAERKKEIDDLLASTSGIPKAPWDDGVCKVCGIDKDDDSVLLCDTCDAEYHTYCLNPPLARIPEGNWYCPSCVVSKQMLQDASEHHQVIRKRCRKNYQGEVTRTYLEALALLAVKMEENEYWEFNVDERTFLLKFLCDELLNSAVIRQHLEHCSETSAELQQKCDTEAGAKDVHAAVHDTSTPGNVSSNAASEKSDISSRLIEFPSSNSLPHEINGSIRKIGCLGHPQDNMEMDVSLPLDQQGVCIPSDVRSIMWDSITSVDFELSKLSVRRNRTVSVQDGMNMTDGRDPTWRGSVTQSCASTGVDSSLPLEGSKAGCPYLFEPNSAIAFSAPWVSYQTDAEIDELIGWLKDKHPKERELKESILQWKKSRFQKFQKTRSQSQDEILTAISVARNGEKTESDCLVTRSATLLEKMYGPCSELETTDISKKRGKRARLTNDEKMYRCECLEPIWPNRYHCLCCHRTFVTDAELEGHSDGRCVPFSAACEKGKEISDSSKGKGSLKCEINREECRGELNSVETSKSVHSELSAKLIKFQNGGLVCPYDFEEICSKFVTNDSNKDLIQEIGLIGSQGVPSFVPSLSPYLSDSTLQLVTQKDVGVHGNGPEAAEQLVLQGKTNADIVGCSSLSGKGGGLLNANIPTLGCLEKGEKRPLGSHSSVISKRLKINLLDIDAAIPEEALRPSKAHLERRWAWRTFVKAAVTIYEMVQATIVLEDMIKTEYLRNEWWYWSSFSAAAKISTMSSLALRIYSLDAAIMYEKMFPSSDPVDKLEPSSVLDLKLLPILDSTEKTRLSRKSNKKRKEPEG
ncbi:methyl-CpG-binding domain-containing protein 9 [Prunus yedoensis var. nudiflora]|uniref:Methyl-CpG-binding domain-containing protein 9 n=1 Tax=Prunus yedoensis var. nudiflora TaxID=2094558 RepID=A0A314XK64_PRUYE|nr:methyl-CpG-binding domain-containing protein 9 [Prunus yedoensis var. nudiflora]